MMLRGVLVGFLMVFAALASRVTIAQDVKPFSDATTLLIAQSNEPAVAPDGTQLTGDAVEIDRAFRTYKQALLDSDGNTAAALLTSETHAYYRRMADDALRARKNTLLSNRHVDCFTALLLRHELTKEQLETMTGEEIVAYLVNKGYVSKSTIENALVGKFEINANQAIGYRWYERGKRYFNLKYFFERENGAWHFDILPLMEKADMGFEIIRARENLYSYEATFLYVLEQATGQKPGPEIWSPPQ